MTWHTVVYQREKLYEEVWAEPVDLVAKRYEVSGVALAKVCRKLGVPLPGRGYWARKRAGQKLQVPKLPPLKGGAQAEISVTRRESPPVPQLAPGQAEAPTHDEDKTPGRFAAARCALDAEMCRLEGWSTRALAQEIAGMLFERTALSKRPEELIPKELAALRAKGEIKAR